MQLNPLLCLKKAQILTCISMTALIFCGVAGVAVQSIGTVLGAVSLTYLGLSKQRRRWAAAMLPALLLSLNASAYLAGDVDGSGTVTQADLDQVVTVILGGNASFATDMDASGGTDAVDYQLIVRLLLGHDIDADDDGLPDALEANIGTNPNDTDSDDDGLTDDVEYEGDTSPTDSDTDDDGLNDGDEVNIHNTDPDDSDSDNDGLSDGDEVNEHGTDPNDADSDNDGLDDSREINETVTDPNDSDTDNDGLDDGDEVNTYGTNPTTDDSDNDGLTDGDELNTYNTDPNDSDSDDDGTNDGDEVANGTDPNTLNASLIITEILALNGTGLTDEDGNTSDWIEIYNPGTTTANLVNWALTDTPNVLDQWLFPAVSIPAGEYLVVFASGLDRRPFDGSNLHTNFGLSPDGEYLALVKPGGQIEHAYTPNYPEQTDDVSYGIFESQKYYFTTPTPGAANSLGIQGFVAKPEFDVPSGIYDASFPLTISTETPGATIRYTTDGTKPTPAAGTVYSTPLNIAGNTIIRAIAYRTGYVDSEIALQSYLYLGDVLSQPAAPPGFPATWGGPGTSNSLIDADYEMDSTIINDPDYSSELGDALNSLPIISLSMPVADWFSAPTGIIANSWNNDNPGWTRLVSAEMFWPDGRKIFNTTAGIRVVGGQSTNSGWKSQKHSLRLKMQPEYGPTRLETNEPILPGSPFTSFNTVTLDARFNHMWHHWDETQRTRAQHLRDVIMNDLQIATDEVSPHGRYTHLFLNGLYWGMYWIHERPDESFLEDYLGGDKEDYDVIKHTPNDVMSGSDNRYNAMLSLARTGTANEATYNQLASEYIQVDPFINYMLLNFYGGNDDWDHHNWYVGGNRAEGTGFRYYSWDAEHTFKDHNLNNTGENNTGMPSELHQLMMQNQEHRIRFGDRAHKLMTNGGLLTEDLLGEYFDVRVNEIYSALALESARWGDNRLNRGETSQRYTRNDHWTAEQNRLRNTYLPQRAGIVLNQLDSRGHYPDVDAPTFNINGSYQHGGEISSGAALTMTNPNGSGTLYYTLDGTDPRVAAEPGDVIQVLEESAPKRALVPTGDIGTDWRTQAGFDDSAWAAGNDGVGYEENSGYEGFIGIDVIAEMLDENGSCYIRIPFDLDGATLASLEALTLRVRYDDGFVAYLNGNATPIAQDRQPSPLAWNSEATGNHTDTEAEQLVNFDISDHIGLLQSGSNFLAIHGMNSGIGSSDFLISVDIQGSTSPSNPEVSPSAINYAVTPPPPLTDTTQVLARVLGASEWSALNDAVYQIDSSDYSALRVTELMYHPADPTQPNYYNDEAFEFIEVKNTGSTTIDLTGVRFTNGVYFRFNDSRIRDAQLLAPGEYIAVAKNPFAFRERYGDEVNLAGPYFGSLNNNGETVELVGPDDGVIVDFAYNNSWFQVTDGLGFSLTAQNESLAADSWDAKEAWRPSSSTGGTPGAGDSAVVPAPGAIVINEVLAHSHDAAADWVELHNTTGGDIDVSGWFLSDSNNDLMKYEFPAGSIVSAGGYLVVYEDVGFGAPNPDSPFALSENGETVFLSSGSNGSLTGYSDEESFGASETGVSFGRYYKASTDSFNFVSMVSNTPGAANSAPLIGPIVITEIMYHPQDAPAGDPDAEYIELYNMSGAAVTLEDSETNISWSMTGAVDFVFPSNTTIPAGGYVVLVLDAAAFNAAYPGVSAPIFQWESGRLSNGGEAVEISKPGDVDGGGTRHHIRVDRVNYSDSAPWPTSPDGAGDALVKTTLGAYGNDVAVWSAGTPDPGQ